MDDYEASQQPSRSIVAHIADCGFRFRVEVSLVVLQVIPQLKYDGVEGD